MDEASLSNIRAQLIARRSRLERVMSDLEATTQLVGLLREVDAALERVGNGTYGICKTCHEAIEDDFLRMDPLACFCLDHLDAAQQRALEHDLDLATRIQGALLPKNGMTAGAWRLHYHYEPAGPVSGDYCDFVTLGKERDGVLFAIGDVSGKGVAASMLMSHLHAIFHSLASFDLPVDQVVTRANRLMCESTMTTHFATLVCGKAAADGTVEICNAGHVAPLVVHGGEVRSIAATGIPIGVFSEAAYTVTRTTVGKGDRIVLHTDGLTEAAAGDLMYGDARVSQVALRVRESSPEDIVGQYVKDLNGFMSNAAKQDDVTIMVIGRMA